MHEKTTKQIKDLIKSGQVKEVITATNGTRKVRVILNDGSEKVFYGEQAKEVLLTTNRY